MKTAESLVGVHTHTHTHTHTSRLIEVIIKNDKVININSNSKLC